MLAKALCAFAKHKVHLLSGLHQLFQTVYCTRESLSCYQSKNQELILSKYSPFQSSHSACVSWTCVSLPCPKSKTAALQAPTARLPRCFLGKLC